MDDAAMFLRLVMCGLHAKLESCIGSEKRA